MLKLRDFFGPIEPGKEYRLTNVETIYHAAQTLIDKVNARDWPLPLSAPITDHVDITVKIRNEIGTIIDENCQLTITLSPDGDLNLRLIATQEEPSVWGDLVVGVPEDYPIDRPAVGVEMFTHSGQGLGAGLGLCIERMCQLWTDVFGGERESVVVEIMDAAHATQPGQSRRRWTSYLVTMLDPGWKKQWLRMLLQPTWPPPPIWHKPFYPSGR
jgi:hypothetical protein